MAVQHTRRQKHRDRYDTHVGDRGEEKRLLCGVTNLGQWDWATRTQVDEVRTSIFHHKCVCSSAQYVYHKQHSYV